MKLDNIATCMHAIEATSPQASPLALPLPVPLSAPPVAPAPCPLQEELGPVSRTLAPTLTLTRPQEELGPVSRITTKEFFDGPYPYLMRPLPPA